MRRLLGLLLAVLLLARGIIPAGFMPVAAHGGSIEIVICTGHGAAIISSHEGSNRSKPVNPIKADDGECPFAATVMAALAPQAAGLLAARVLAIDRQVPPETLALSSRRIEHASARAPPVLQS